MLAASNNNNNNNKLIMSTPVWKKKANVGQLEENVLPLESVGLKVEKLYKCPYQRFWIDL